MSKPKQLKVLGLAVAGAFLLCATAASADPVKLEPRIMLSAGQLAELKAQADQGPQALRSFIRRTQQIYNYYWPDVVGGPDIYF
jgi:hypothetical protein